LIIKYEENDGFVAEVHGTNKWLNPIKLARLGPCDFDFDFDSAERLVARGQSTHVPLLPLPLVAP
jgi:hypothetical protein